MQSLVQKFRNFLEASWALSPTMVGMACLTLDLAALLHWRLRTTHAATGYREVRYPESRTYRAAAVDGSLNLT